MARFTASASGKSLTLTSSSHQQIKQRRENYSTRDILVALPLSTSTLENEKSPDHLELNGKLPTIASILPPHCVAEAYESPIEARAEKF
jgi:hypothetical protein